VVENKQQRYGWPVGRSAAQPHETTKKQTRIVMDEIRRNSVLAFTKTVFHVFVCG